MFSDDEGGEFYEDIDVSPHRGASFAQSINQQDP